MINRNKYQRVRLTTISTDEIICNMYVHTFACNRSKLHRAIIVEHSVTDNTVYMLIYSNYVTCISHSRVSRCHRRVLRSIARARSQITSEIRFGFRFFTSVRYRLFVYATTPRLIHVSTYGVYLDTEFTMVIYTLHHVC